VFLICTLLGVFCNEKKLEPKGEWGKKYPGKRELNIAKKLRRFISFLLGLFCLSLSEVKFPFY